MNVLWRKVWSDVWTNKGRTLLVVLSLAVGVFAVGMIFGMADQMVTTMDQTWHEDMPQHIAMYLETPISRSDILALRQLPGVDDIAPAGALDARYRTASDNHWHQAVIMMRPDYLNQHFDILRLDAGVWPQGANMGMEHMQADYYHVKPGDQVTLEVSGKEYTVPITGTLRHPYAPPPSLGNDLLFFFADAEEMAALGIPAGEFNTLLIRVTPYSDDLAQQVASEVKTSLAGQNVAVYEIDYQDPSRHWGRTQLDPLVLLMQVMAAASLLLSTSLILNTLTALITQQTNQIGILKTVGGTRMKIMQCYLAIVMVYGLLALCLSFPLGVQAAFYSSRFFLSFYDIPHEVFEISTQAVIFQLLAGLIVPPLAALAPILNGVRITVSQALASHGIGADFGSTWLDRAVQRVGSALLPSRYAAALANTFRRKRRLILTEVVLIAAGALFLMLMTVQSSVNATLGAEFERRNYDLTVRFGQAQALDRAIPSASSVAGVDRAALLPSYPSNILHQGAKPDEIGTHSPLIGVPLADALTQPFVVEGRWLQSGDEHAIVIGRDIAAAGKFKVGDVVTLDLTGHGRSDWQIVGLHGEVVTSQLSKTNTYASRDAVWQATKQAGWGDVLVIQTARHDNASVNAVADQLQVLYRKEGIRIAEIKTSPEERRSLGKEFSTVLSLLGVLMLLTAVVGGMGLVGALSISVIERTREIGILRAIGARSATIMGVFVLEALVQTVLSWTFALPVSVIGARPLSNALGQIMFGINLDYQYSFPATVLWLILVLVIGILAAILPARHASQIQVRQSLAYE